MESNIIEAIRKLLALSKSDNEHEAALALEKAQALLLRHNLDMAAVTESKEPDSETAMINEVVDFDTWQPWRRRLLNSIAMRQFCHVIGTGDREAHILGKRTNIRVAVELYNWVEPQIERLAESSGYKRGDKTSYIGGIIDTIARQLDIGRREFEAKPDCRALVVNVQGESDRWYRRCFPKVVTTRSTISNGSAYSHGQRDGQRVSMTGASRQVGGRLLLT